MHETLASGDGTSLRDPHQCEIDIRQLRHLTRNGLQRVISSLDQVPGLRTSAEGRLLAGRVERVICASAAVSDALFGMTRQPTPMVDRLRSLCTALTSLYADPDQRIKCRVSVIGECPREYSETVMRVANELVGNAIKHGMSLRLAGSIGVELVADQDGRTVLRITDDGFGIGASFGGHGEGLRLARALARSHRGSVAVEYGALTVAELILPRHPGEGSAARLSRRQAAAGKRGLDSRIRDSVVIGFMAVLLIAGMAVADAITLSLPPLRSLCIGGTLLAGSHCPPDR